MLIKIAWRNIWRNHLRSLVVMVALALGIGAAIFLISFSWGASEQRVRDIIALKMAHFQIHHADYEIDRGISYFLPEGQKMVDDLRAIPEVAAVTSRVVTMGFAQTAHNTNGVKVFGINPDEEQQVFNLQSKIIEGDFFESKKKSAIVLGKRLAEKLKVTIGRKLTVNFTDPDGNLIAGSFKVIGIYKTSDSKFDELHVYVRASVLQGKSMLNRPGEFHEIAFTLKNKADALDAVTVDQEKAKLVAAFPGVKLESWRDLDPATKIMVDTFDQSLQIIMGIILLALGFGIVNTMLMAVLERKRELGMLMCVGMNQRKVFSMIMLETFFLVLIGAPIGMLAAALLIGHFGVAGIDMSMFGAGFESMGLSPIIYPALKGDYYIDIVIMVAITAIVSAIFPAYKAVKLEASEAVRAI